MTDPKPPEPADTPPRKPVPSIAELEAMGFVRRPSTGKGIILPVGRKPSQ